MRIYREILVMLVFMGMLMASPVEGAVQLEQRYHDPLIKTKVIVNEANTVFNHGDEQKSFKERIRAILDMSEAQPAPVVVNASEPDAIMGRPIATPEQCVKYLLSVNPRPNLTVPLQELVTYYYEEGTREGVRPDVAFAQALKETGFFRYGGTVTPDQNNYCGLGTTSTEVKGAYFPSSQLGVRAHIQHLLAYATTRRPQAPVVDPRYDLVRAVYHDSTIGTWEGLNGRWAVPGYTYGQSILQIFGNILRE